MGLPWYEVSKDTSGCSRGFLVVVEILASEDLEGMEAFVSLNACSEDRLTEGEAGSFLLYGKTLHTLIFDHKIERHEGMH